MKRNTYFVLNGGNGFKRGYENGITTDADKITLEANCQTGVFYTSVLDSRERLMVWHRLVTDGIFGEASVAVTAYASDTLYPEHGMDSIGEIIRQTSLTQKQKDEIFQAYRKADFYEPKDVLLHQVTGRYLWLKIVLKTQGEWVPKVKRIRIYFPKHTWLSYLPEIYQEDRESASFLERYLGIFQSLYDDMTEKIDQIPRLFDPVMEDACLLNELTDWFSLEHRNLWNKEQLSWLVQNADRISQTRGTVSCLKELVRLHTGKEPCVVEYHQIQPYFDGGVREQVLKKLYAGHPYEFAVLLDVSDLASNHRFTVLEQVIDMVKPAHMESRIIALKPYIFLDQHSYLGMNSVLGRYQPIRLNGLCAVPFSIISKEEGEEDL